MHTDKQTERQTEKTGAVAREGQRAEECRPADISLPVTVIPIAGILTGLQGESGSNGVPL